MCAPCGCWGVWRATTSCVAGSSDPASTCERRRALALTGLRCFIGVLELLEKPRVELRNRAVDLKTGIGPSANPVAVVQVRLVGGAESRVGLVITAAGAERPRPARLAIGLVAHVMRLEKIVLLRAIDAARDRAELVIVRAGEAMTQRHITRGRNTEKTEAGAARPRLARTLVNFTEGFAHVAESVMAILERRGQIILRERAEFL